jgi:hypothetical protein
VPSAFRNCTLMMLEPASRTNWRILAVLSMGRKDGEALASLPHNCAFACPCKPPERLALLIAYPVDFSPQIVLDALCANDLR